MEWEGGRIGLIEGDCGLIILYFGRELADFG